MMSALRQWTASLPRGRLVSISLVMLAASGVARMEGNAARRGHEDALHAPLMELELAIAARDQLARDSTMVVNGTQPERLPEALRSLRARRADVERRHDNAQVAFQRERDREHTFARRARIFDWLCYAGVALVTMLWLLRLGATPRA